MGNLKVLLINSVCGIGSTGRICVNLAKEYEKNGANVKIAYGRNSFVPEDCKKYAVRIGNDLDVKIHALKTRLLDKHGLGSKRATRKFLKWAEEFNPDISWLHNLHGYYIHVGLLFEWIKSRPNMKVKWTLHDCWAFTGHCSHFSFNKCERWKYGCGKCEFVKDYPKSIRDGSQKNFELKKSAFTGVKDMELIVPSEWLKNLVKQSFLQEYPVNVVRNIIDLKTFQPTKSEFKKVYNIENKKIVLGVSNGWGKRKGFDDFIKLSKILPEDYLIVLVGVEDDKIKSLPKNMLGLPCTNSAKALAEIYTAADVFVNLTYEDNYPTVNLEAQACGTPCITYRTGGSPESVPDANVVEQCDLEAVIKLIENFDKLEIKNPSEIL